MITGGNLDCARQHFDKLIPLAEPGKPWGEEKKMKNICGALKTARDDLDKKFLIMFAGAFSVGKSTLVNNFLGEEVCATGRDPTTDDLDEYLWEGRLLVDSPGLDAWNQPEHKKKALEAARRSNLAVLVTSALQPLGDREVPILKELVRAQSKITVAINYWNFLETDEDRRQVEEHVQKCLKEIMPGISVEIFKVNAKKNGDPGVQKLSQFLRSRDDSGQKLVSAKAAIQNAVQQMLEMCAVYDVKETEEHEKKLQELERQLESLEKDVKHSEELWQLWRQKIESQLQLLQRELEIEQASSSGSIGSIVDGAEKGASAGARAGGAAGALVGGVVGGILGAGSADSAQKRKEHLQSAREQLERELQDAQTSKPSTDAQNKLRRCEEKKKQESKIYEQKKKALAVDRTMLEQFL